MPGMLFAFALALLVPPSLPATKDLTLDALVTPSAVFVKDGQPVTFARLGFIEFKTLAELFSYIDREAGRWSFPNTAARQAFGDRLLRRGVESRLISMTYEKPLELLLTHTREELDRAVLDPIAKTAPIFAGRNWRVDASVYRQTFLDIQQRWKTSLAESRRSCRPWPGLALPAAIPSASCAWSTLRSARSRPSCVAGWPRASVPPTSSVSPTT